MRRRNVSVLVERVQRRAGHRPRPPPRSPRRVQPPRRQAPRSPLRAGITYVLLFLPLCTHSNCLAPQPVNTPPMLDAHRPQPPPAFSLPTPSLLPLRPVSAQPSPLSLSAARTAKARLLPSVNPKDLAPMPFPGMPVPFTFAAPVITEFSVPLPSPPPLLADNVPAKRRREPEAPTEPVSAPTTSPTTPATARTSRRRTRSWHTDHHQSPHGQGNGSTSGDAMNVEEEGPQRKHVARR